MKSTLLREMLGESLREQRFAQGRTLREVSSAARVSLGYLSEVERGQKEASSELISAICTALDLPQSDLMRIVSDRCSRTKTPRNTASLLRLERTKLVRFPVPGPGTSTFRTRQRIVSALAGGRGTVSRWARGRFESRYPVRAAGLVLRGQQSRL